MDGGKLLSDEQQNQLAEYLKNKPPTFKIGRMELARNGIKYGAEKLEMYETLSTAERIPDKWHVSHLIATSGQSRQVMDLCGETEQNRYAQMASYFLYHVCGPYASISST